MEPKDYRNMIQAFLNGDLPVSEFEALYLQAFKAEKGKINRSLFNILEDLFEDVDAYSPMWSAEDESLFRITEESLRHEAAEALAKLDEWLRKNPSAK